MHHNVIIKDGNTTKVVKKVLVDGVQFVDDAPIEGSSNLASSNGVAKAIGDTKESVDEDVQDLQEQINDIAEKAGSGYIPKGEATVATLNALSGQENGELYTMTDAGTLTEGSLAVVAGDTVAWDATNEVWYKAMDYAPRQYGTNEVHNLPTTITAFRTGDVIPVDGPSGTAKMSKDDLLQSTAQNALGSIKNLTSATDAEVSDSYVAVDGSNGAKKATANKVVKSGGGLIAQSGAPVFSSTKDYPIGDIVSYNGQTYMFCFAHAAGDFDSTEVTAVDYDYFTKANSPLMGQPLSSTGIAVTIKHIPLRWVNGLRYVVENTGYSPVNIYLMRKKSSSASDSVLTKTISVGGTFEFVCDNDHWFCYLNQYSNYTNSIKVSCGSPFSAVFPEFKPENNYSVGDIVTRFGKLYRFWTAHTAGAFNSSEVFELDLNYLIQIYDNLSAVSNITIPQNTVTSHPIENIKGVTYRIRNSGQKTTYCYLMKKKSVQQTDAAVTLGAISSGEYITYTCDDNSPSFFFLNMYCAEQGGSSIVVEKEVAGLKRLAGSLYPTFSATREYQKGDFCWYGDYLYCFCKDHTAGAWNTSDVFQTDENYITISEGILSRPRTTKGGAGAVVLTPLKWVEGYTYKFTNTGASTVYLYVMKTKSTQQADVCKYFGGIASGASIVYTCNAIEVFFYLSQYSTGATEVKIERVNPSNRNIFKSCSIIGDSYSTFQGYLPSGYATYYKNDNTQSPELPNGVKDTWWFKLFESLKISLFRNDSWSGSTISNTVRPGLPDSSSMVRRIDSIFAQSKITEVKPDLLLFFGGTNDSWLGNEHGEPKYSGWTESDLKKTLPALCYCFDTLMKWNLGTQIVFILNSDLNATLNAGVVTSCQHYGIPLVKLHDIEKESGHPTPTGMTTIFEQVSVMLKSLS